MKKLLLFLMIVLSVVQLTAQKNAIWKQVTSESIHQSEKLRTSEYSERQQLFQINVSQLKNSLANAADKFSGQPGIAIDFPNSNGELERFMVWENSNFAPELQAQYPDIRAYVGTSNVDGATINFSISPAGFQALTLRADQGSEFIEPYTKNSSTYILFDSQTRLTGKLPFNCSTVDQELSQDLSNNSQVSNRSSNQSYKTMRLALSCVGEYTTFFGGTVAGALAGMNATMTRVNGVFEKDLAIHLNIIATNNLVIYTNAGTDPYSNGATGSGGAWNAELQNTLTSVIGEANYDIGHLFGASGGGGNAGCIGCVCSNGSKGSGFTSPSNNVPQGDTFDIDYVVHEMGHQLGANHSFSHATEGSGVNVEPGSGSTIMGYAGITSYNVQSNSDAYFTYRNILQIQTNLATKTCPVSTVITNTPPTINAGIDLILPKGTAFILKGIATDAEADALTYCWEQNNTGTGATTNANSVASPTKTVGPNFRSFTGTASPDRYMPAYATVLSGSLSTMWESVSTVARASKYTCTVRDNHVPGAQTSTDEITLNTSSTVGPFAVTSQNATGTAWAQGTPQTITWSVNGTTTLVGSTNVNIKLSIDGGITFPYTLASNTPNDGTEIITVPVTPASLNCRLWIEPTANIYYAVNSTPFYIGYQITNTCTTYTYNTPFALPFSTSFTQKTINVPTAGTISDVNVTINATHPNLQNLFISMIRPSGPLLNIYNQQCAGSANMNVTFDSAGGAITCASPTQGTYAPPTGVSMNTLNGFSQQGNWIFGFKDLVSADSGTINSIALEVCSQTVQLLADVNFEFENFALFPNPNNGNFDIRFNSESSTKINIAIHDLRGRKIFDKEYANTGMFSQNLQLENAQSGIYLVSITDGVKKVVKRIVIQ